ncbi:MAG: universal stress protein [Elusimicrobia bacterium]|nr:universal stress protein [Elusimicrobiota bacterium]
MIQFPPKKILVAYDLSDVSRIAWRHAVALAADCGAELEAVFVQPWGAGVDLMPPPRLTPAEARSLRAKIRAAVGDGPKITILQGDPAGRILSLARLHRPQLIVVGTHGRKGFERAILGSVAETVIRGSSVPVLAARGPVRPVRSILAPVNFTPYSDYGFAYAAAASAVLSAQLTALHATVDPIWEGNPRYRLSNLIHHLPAKLRENCRPTAQEFTGTAVKSILKAQRGHDWIVLVSHEKAPFKEAFFGTTLEQVLRRSPVPVLSVPALESAHFALRIHEGSPISRK